MIYCFSGTGNSLSTARMLGEKTGEDVLQISEAYKNKSFDASAEDVIGLVFPTYWGTVPTFVKKFVNELKINPDAYVFVVATCGGGPGNTLADAVALFDAKGVKVSYARVYELPDNTAMIYGSPYDLATLDSQASLVAGYAADINARSTNLGDIRRSAVVGLGAIIADPSIKFMGKLMKANSDCTHCGTCAKVCPVENITVTPKKVKFGSRCVGCMTCMHWCPQGAIQYSVLKFGKDHQYRHPDVNIKDMMK